jgi:alkanesulfonate monooxygenase SsuD/methylene tetrahydromethanopterin reductase-like flavin-dependent oxidoreductase (luciferase family)
VKLALLADEAGIEFILPVAKWKGYRGRANVLGRSFETLTHGAALAALTRRIAIFSTVHVPLVTPAFAAKAIATIDHVSHGRAGLNIVCGWNQEEFDVHGVTIDAERRYDHGLEWFRIWSRLLAGGPEFDWDGEFFKLKGLDTDPVSVQRPWPVVMSAGFSAKGRDFAAQAADVLFTTMTEIGQGQALIGDIHAYAARYGRKMDVYTMSHVVCRPTRREAEDFYYYFAEEMADREALDHYKQQKGIAARGDPRYIERPLATRFSRATGKSYAGSYPGAYPLVGTPDVVVEELMRMQKLGLAGTSVAFLHYLEEIPFFIAEVMPRMVRAGLRVA